MKFTDNQNKAILDHVNQGHLVFVGQYLGSKLEHMTWEAREAQGMTPGRSAGSMTFASHIVLVGLQGQMQALTIRVGMPKGVEWEKVKAEEWTDRSALKPSPALVVGSTVLCVMAAYWTDKGAVTSDAQTIIPLA